MAGAVNVQAGDPAQLNWKQEMVVEMVEMYHTSSLYHDDVIDAASTRRGQPTASSAWSPRHAVLGGDFVLASAYSLLGKIDNQEVTESMSKTLADLVAGELLQMAGGLNSSKEGVQLYTHKCFLKTGTLFAHSCRSIALLSTAPCRTGRDIRQGAWHRLSGDLCCKQLKKYGVHRLLTTSSTMCPALRISENLAQGPT